MGLAIVIFFSTKVTKIRLFRTNYTGSLKISIGYGQYFLTPLQSWKNEGEIADSMRFQGIPGILGIPWTQNQLFFP